MSSTRIVRTAVVRTPGLGLGLVVLVLVLRIWSCSHHWQHKTSIVWQIFGANIQILTSSIGRHLGILTYEIVDVFTTRWKVVTHHICKPGDWPAHPQSLLPSSHLALGARTVDAYVTDGILYMAYVERKLGTWLSSQQRGGGVVCTGSSDVHSSCLHTERVRRPAVCCHIATLGKLFTDTRASVYNVVPATDSYRLTGLAARASQTIKSFTLHC